MDWKQYTQAILQGAQADAPASSIPELSQAMRGSFRASALERPGKAQEVAANEQAKRDEEASREAFRKKQQQLADMLDPGKYEKRRKDDGGFAFFDPTGKEIDIDTYAKRTGLRRVDILSDSENPVDLQFIDDYTMMNELNQAAWRNDAATLSEFKSMYPSLFSDKGKAPTIEELNKRMLEKYPHMFGRGQYEISRRNLGSPIFRAYGDYGSGGNNGRRSGLSL